MPFVDDLRLQQTGRVWCDMNKFDIAIYAGFLIAVAGGFNTGLVRSAITILAYVVAMPITIYAMSYLPPTGGNTAAPIMMQNWGLFLGGFLLIGMALGKLARISVDEAIGDDPGIADRFGGAALGALRVGLVATSVVLVFDQLSPPGREPAFLKGSQLRPFFSALGQRGFRSLPPEATTAIERLKRERRI
jgi:membrane protein required for colicin V production